MTALTTPQLLLLAGGLATAALLMAVAAFTGRESGRLQERLQAAVRQASGRAPAAETTQPPAEIRQTAGRALLRHVAVLSSRLPLVGRNDQDDIRRILVRAGVRSKEGQTLYVAAKLLCFAVAAALTAGALLLLPESPGPMAGLAVTAFGAFVGGLAPEIALKRRAGRRRAAIQNTLPDALDLMIICANAGYGLDVSLQRVGREMARFAPELADELAVTASEMQLLADRREALDNLVERTNVPSLRSLVVTLIQAQRYGTPLTQALRTLAKEERNTRILALEEKAARLPALISLPLMVLIMPAVFIVVAGPAFIDIMKGL